MMFSFRVLCISLTGIIIENTMVRSELTCDGHNQRTMMVQLLTLRKEFEDYKFKAENVIQSLSERHTKYENDIYLMSKTIQGLNDTVHAQNAIIQGTLTNLIKSVKVIQDFNTAVQEMLKDKTCELVDLKCPVSYQLVSFIATSRNDKACNGNVRYETTVTNYGRAYDSSTGYFTAPYKGMYLFSIQFCGFWVKLQIYSPNRNQYYSATKYSDARETGCTSVTSTAYLSKDDQLYVKCTADGYSPSTANNQYDYWNMFTGVLINTY